ncbi:MAG: IMPACT family protein [Oscillospiraceae bacterium]
MENYQTLGGAATASITEKKSEFIGNACPATSEEAALAFLEQIRSQHRTAAHNVYAYALRHQGRQRYSDDGEPTKTAGLPVLNVLAHSGVVDCIVVVTRYFGGVLLGTGGLVRAYTAAAKAVLEKAEILTMQQCVTLRLTVGYPLFEPVQRIMAEAGAHLSPPLFADAVGLSATLPAGLHLPLVEKLNELCRGEANILVSPPFYAPF